MKKVILLILSIIFIYLLYNSLFSYRIVAILNDGNLKYKDGARFVTFSRPPFSIINPFKKNSILDKIQKYCNSDEFYSYYYSHNYQTIKHMDYFYCKRISIENKLVIKALKDENNNLLILVAELNHIERDYIFILDKTTDKIIGYY